MRNNFSLAIILGSLLMPVCAQTQTFEGWLQAQIDAEVNAKRSALAQQQVAQNSKGADRQKSSPSTDPRSTSLVDQSSASDFLSIAANLLPVAPGLSNPGAPTTAGSADSNASGSTTATASLYSILTALKKRSPTDPTFYKDHVNARRLFFTLGTAASTQATDNTTTPATVYGAKLLLINGRELYKSDNLGVIQNLQDNVARAAAASVAVTSKVKTLIYAALNPSDVDGQGRPKLGSQQERDKFEEFVRTHFATEAGWQTTLSSLTPDTLKRIHALIAEQQATFADEKHSLEQGYDDISHRMQMSLSYTANIRDSKGNNDHRAELIFDFGKHPRITWTINASADYTDRKLAASSEGGRFATGFQGDLTKKAIGDLRTPLRLTFSGEGKWLTSQKPQYSFDVGLSVPLTSGMDLPIVYRYANRAGQVNQKDFEARLGLSIDVSRLVQAFK